MLGTIFKAIKNDRVFFFYPTILWSNIQKTNTDFNIPHDDRYQNIKIGINSRSTSYLNSNIMYVIDGNKCQSFVSQS